MNTSQPIRQALLPIVFLISVIVTGESNGEQVLRPKCNVKVQVFDAPRQSLVPPGTKLYKCPSEAGGNDGILAVEGHFKIVGEYGDWYEWEGINAKAGKYGYFRKAGVTFKSDATAGTTTGTAAGIASNSGTVGSSSRDAKTSGQPVVQFPPCQKNSGNGDLEVIVYVDEAMNMSDDASIKSIFVNAATEARQTCGRPIRHFYLRMLPKAALTDRNRAGRYWAGADADYNQQTGTLGDLYRYYNNEGRIRENAIEQRERQKADKAEKQAPLVAFFKRTHVQELVWSEKLAANPFAYEGKIVATLVTFDGMLSRTDATFDGLVAIGVPPTRFVDQRKQLILVGRVKGLGKYTMPVVGEVQRAQLSYVDAYTDSFESWVLEPALAEALGR